MAAGGSAYMREAHVFHVQGCCVYSVLIGVTVVQYLDNGHRE